jgi:uncharacterized protein YecE (DUF72 family)
VRLHVGTSGYNFPEWKGSFYPEKLPAKKMLEFYATQLATVEINYTFYRMPKPEIVAGWAATVPDGFTFVLKVPQRITHILRLKDVDDPLRYFCETAAGLGPKLGPILLQLPPNFKKASDRLANVLAQLPPGIRCACEFRHASWLDEETYALMRQYNAALCVADTDEATTPLIATANFGYLRLRDEGYSGDELAQWATSVRELGQHWTDAYVFFKHEEQGMGPKLAREFLSLVPN